MIGYLTLNHSLIHAFQPRPAKRTRREALAVSRVFKMAPKLSDYFQSDEIIAVKGSLDRPISGLALDSRRVVPGMLLPITAQGPNRPPKAAFTFARAAVA